MSELTKALVEVQANLPAISKGEIAKVGQYSYSYASLPTITEAILPVLSNHGLAWTTRPTFDEHGAFVLVYELRHISGEALAGCYPLPDASSKAQEIGSAITYARRYALCSVVGIAPDDDDDGNLAQNAPPARLGGKPKAQSSARPAQAPPSRTVDETTGEIGEAPAVQAAIDKLDQDGRKQLLDKMEAAHYPPVGSLQPAAAKQVVKWAEEIKKAQAAEEPF